MPPGIKTDSPLDPGQPTPSTSPPMPEMTTTTQTPDPSHPSPIHHDNSGNHDFELLNIKAKMVELEHDAKAKLARLMKELATVVAKRQDLERQLDTFAEVVRLSVLPSGEGRERVRDEDEEAKYVLRRRSGDEESGDNTDSTDNNDRRNDSKNSKNDNENDNAEKRPDLARLRTWSSHVKRKMKSTLLRTDEWSNLCRTNPDLADKLITFLIKIDKLYGPEEQAERGQIDVFKTAIEEVFEIDVRKTVEDMIQSETDAYEEYEKEALRKIADGEEDGNAVLEREQQYVNFREKIDALQIPNISRPAGLEMAIHQGRLAADMVVSKAKDLVHELGRDRVVKAFWRTKHKIAEMEGEWEGLGMLKLAKGEKCRCRGVVIVGDRSGECRWCAGRVH